MAASLASRLDDVERNGCANCVFVIELVCTTNHKNVDVWLLRMWCWRMWCWLQPGSLASVRQFSEQILQEEPEIHVLINNAGVMFPPYTKTEDGHELQFAVNHLGHFLLTHLLLDCIKSSSPSRILAVASHGHYAGSLDFGDMMWTKRYQPQLAYCRSKLANVMFVRELAKRLAGTGVTVYAIHPGSVNTELPRHLQQYCWGLFKVIILDHSSHNLVLSPAVRVLWFCYRSLHKDTSSRSPDIHPLCSSSRG